MLSQSPKKARTIITARICFPFTKMDQSETPAENALISDLIPVNSAENPAVIRTLLERLIDGIPRDPQGRTQCFNTICHFFHQRGLIDSWSKNEYESIDLIFQGWLNRRVGSYDIKSSPEQKYQPQYLQNFIELGRIGEGGFGKVYKARNKWDGVEYAIKKIRISEHSCKSYLEEAEIIARLNHPNIVPYKATWVEELCESSKKKKRSRKTKQSVTISFSEESNIFNSNEYVLSLTSKKDDSSSDFEIVFEDSADHTDANEVEASSHVYEKDSLEAVSSSLTSNISTTCSKTEKNTMELEGGKSLVLFIQMSLCRCTLREWLIERNYQKPPATEDSIRQTALQIFVQLLQALKYIHAKKIIHHDIKPKNIFISNDDDGLVVQLGDFGLACSLDKTVHNDVKGTDLYVAPEQLKGMCNVKSDMYSLGVVLFELLNTFHTDMERCKELGKLKCQKWNKEGVNEETSLETVAAALTTYNPNLRPSAATLLEILEARAHSDRIKELLGETKELRRLISEKDQEIENLKDLLQQHNISCH